MGRTPVSRLGRRNPRRLEDARIGPSRPRRLRRVVLRLAAVASAPAASRPRRPAGLETPTGPRLAAKARGLAQSRRHARPVVGRPARRYVAGVIFCLVPATVVAVVSRKPAAEAVALPLVVAAGLGVVDGAPVSEAGVSALLA